jgi:diguanylate cyclase (GGDEF)-like protein
LVELTAAGENVSVMIVDDDESSRKGMMLAMRELAHPCVTARDGIEALEMYREKPVDLIISDWSMPRMSGVELCRAIRAEEQRYAYFIFTTALSDKSHLLEGMRAGADDFIGKPLDFDELEARLISARRTIGLHRSLATRNRSLRRESQQSFRAARIDPLTNTRNRLALMEDLEGVAATSTRYGQHFCLAMCDVDHFKIYNDHFGHLAGDLALARVAEVISSELRKSDTLYRFGGEEFVVTLPQQTRETAKIAMDRIRGAVERAAIPHGPGASMPVVTVSVGIAELDHDDVEGCLKAADEALYRAKGRGRNRVET